MIGEVKEEIMTELERGLDLLVEQRRRRREIMKMIQRMTPIFPRNQCSQNERYFQYAWGHLIVLLLQEEMQEEETLLQKEKLTSGRLKLDRTFSE